MNDVIALGNAIVDILVKIDYNELEKLGLKSGAMNGIQEHLSHYVASGDTASGGSAANTLSTFAALGGKCIFYGCVSDDSHGELFKKELEELGIKVNLAKKEGVTGKALTFITPDAERTFAVDIGVASKISKDHLLEEDIAMSKILHIESYLLLDAESRDSVLYAIELAKKHNVKVSFDLNDEFVIKGNFDLVKQIVKDSFVVFMNEDEVKAFTGLEDARESIKQFSNSIVVVKLGSEGSLIQENGKIYEVPAFKVDAVDTTGAGDSYAAGILYGIVNNIPLVKAGRIGSYIASKVVQQVGARYKGDIKKEIETLE